MATLMDKAKGFVVDKVVGMEKPSADITDVSIKHVNTDSVTLDADVDIMNPYSHDLPIGGIAYRLSSADKVIASGNIADPGSIMANDKTRFNIPMKVPYNFIITLMKDLGKDGDLDYEWEVGLTMRIPIVGKFTLPISKEGTLKMPTLSDMF